jgi:hypothetical protein
MLNVLPPTRRWAIPRAWHAVAWCMSLVLGSLLTARAQDEPDTKKGSPPGNKGDSKQAGKSAAKGKAESDKAADAEKGADATAHPVDPSQTRKIAPAEVFRDERAEKLLGMEKLKSSPARPVGQSELADFKAQAGGVNANINQALIKQVVQAMVGKLTDRANVQALVDPPENQNIHAPAARGVHEATTILLEPIFMAKSIKNQAFLTVYLRALREELVPLLKNHLIPRVQAMIILGECATPEFLPLYIAQIKDKTQTIWVKLWALEGLVNIVDQGGRLTAQDQINAAEAVAGFLETESDIPWPVQLRGVEVLSAMRQGYNPTKPQKATMANAAMALLADGSAKVEVRSEAARALGQMPIGAAVSKYNYPLVAHAAGQLATELGNRVGTTYNVNQDKARYLASLLIGPVYQAFDGVPGARDSGLLHATGGASATYIQKVFDLIKPVVQGTVDLLSAGQRQAKDRQKELVVHVAALKEFLEKNQPPDRHLVPDGAAFPIALLPDIGLGPADAPLAGARKNK